MSKPIRVTEEIYKSLMKDFSEKILQTTMFSGRLEYSKEFVWKKGKKAEISFAPQAYTKMLALVNTFESEVSWHGVVHRDEENDRRFVIDDILIFPQQVNGSKVDTDQKEYEEWLYSPKLKDVFNNIRFHGHSHVNFPTMPSAVDNEYQRDIIAQLDEDDYYIFIIWNKKMQFDARIWDMTCNTVYETADIVVTIDGAGGDLDEFVKNAKSLVKPKTVTTTAESASGFSSWTDNGPRNESKDYYYDGYGRYDLSSYKKGGAY